jgi:hypothetical protein
MHLNALEELDNHSWDDNVLRDPQVHCQCCEAVSATEIVSQSLQALILPQLHRAVHAIQC